MRVDLHIHTSERSACARSRAVEQLAAARDSGLDAVAITDHHALVPAAERARLRALFPTILILAHPFRFLPKINIDLDTYPPDAIELYSSNIQPRHHRKIRQVAARLGVPVVANSDAHSIEAIGIYANRLESRAISAAEVVAAIVEGRFTVDHGHTN